MALTYASFYHLTIYALVAVALTLCALALVLVRMRRSLGGLARRQALLERSLQDIVRSLTAPRDLKKVAAAIPKRSRRRYIVFQVVSDRRISSGELKSALTEVCRSMLGEVFVVDSGIKLVDYEPRTGRGIVRVRHAYKYKLLAMLGLVREVGGNRVLIYPLTTTGSLKRARKLLARPLKSAGR